MNSELKLISFEDAKSISLKNSLCAKGSILYECGLSCIHNQECWYNSQNKVSYLTIVDKKKWFLAKIKYGF